MEPSDGRVTSGIWNDRSGGYVAEYREHFSLEEALDFLCRSRHVRTLNGPVRYQQGSAVNARLFGGRYVVMQGGVVLWSA
jgi:hypothetical protein